MKKIVTLIFGMMVAQLGVFGYSKDNVQQRSLGFEQNKGQISDQYGAARPDIQYRLCVGGMTVFVGDGQLHYEFYKKIPNTDSRYDKLRAAFASKHIPFPGQIVTYRMDVSLLGANLGAPSTAELPGNDVANYYTGHTGKAGATGLRSYQRITYKDIYPGIDWVLYIKDNHLEYDFVVHPGANPQDIRIGYGGATKLAIPAEGGLLAGTPFGTITEQRPFAYQQEDHKQVDARYQLQGNTLGFMTGAYSGTLVLDPAVAWATYYGGALDEGTMSTAFDSRGYVYMTGEATSANGIATTGSYQDTLSGGYASAFLVKFDTLGNRIWATYYGGDSSNANAFSLFAGTNLATNLAIDEANNYVYMSGGTNSVNNIATPGSYQDTLSAADVPSALGVILDMDAFLVQFDTLGVRNWATYLGGDSSDEGFVVSRAALVYDPLSGNVDIGLTVANSNMGTAGAYQPDYAGGDVDGGDVLITQFNTQGARQWATYYGGTGDEYINAIALDPAGNLYLAGSTTDTSGIATANSFLPTISATGSVSGLAFLAKLNNNGTARYWGTYYGENGEYAYGTACDRFGHVYITGLTTTVEQPGSNTITTPGAYQTLFGGVGTSTQLHNAFLVQFDTSGNRKWGTYYGGQDYDYGFNVVCDYSGNVFFAGTTNSPSFSHPYLIGTPDSHQDSLAGNYLDGNSDAYVAEFDTSGGRIWGTYYGGLGTEGGGVGFLEGLGLASDGKGGVYLAGVTNSYTGIATPGSFQDTLAVDSAQTTTGNNTFLVRFVPLDAAIVSIGDTACTGSVPFEIVLSNKGRLQVDSFQVTTVYTNNATGAKDSVTATETQLITPGGSATLSMGSTAISVGTYSVRVYVHHVTDDSSFVDDTLYSSVVVQNCTAGIAGVDAKSAIVVYPNPAQQTLSIQVPDGMHATQLTIVNSIGSTVKTENINVQNATKILDIHGLADGFYILKISTARGIYNMPFQKLD